MVQNKQTFMKIWHFNFLLIHFVLERQHTDIKQQLSVLQMFHSILCYTLVINILKLRINFFVTFRFSLENFYLHAFKLHR